MRDAKSRLVQEGDIALIPVKLTRVHSGHASAVSVEKRADGGKDTFYVDTRTVFIVRPEDLEQVRAMEFERAEPKTEPEPA